MHVCVWVCVRRVLIHQRKSFNLFRAFVFVWNFRWLICLPLRLVFCFYYFYNIEFSLLTPPPDWLADTVTRWWYNGKAFYATKQKHKRKLWRAHTHKYIFICICITRSLTRVGAHTNKSAKCLIILQMDRIHDAICLHICIYMYASMCVCVSVYMRACAVAANLFSPC